MIARCIHKSGAVLESASGDGRYTSDHYWEVSPGVEYVILGMGIFLRGLDVLVWADTDKPYWHPIGLFHIPIQPFPAHWEFALYDAETIETFGWVSCWGYPELVRNLQHNVDIQEREPEALQICREEFERRREEGRR